MSKNLTVSVFLSVEQNGKEVLLDEDGEEDERFFTIEFKED